MSVYLLLSMPEVRFLLHFSIIHLFSRGSSNLWLCVPVRPGLSVASQQVDEGLDLPGRDVFFQQLAVVVQQGGDGVLGQDLVADLRLHD